MTSLAEWQEIESIDTVGGVRIFTRMVEQGLRRVYDGLIAAFPRSMFQSCLSLQSQENYWGI